MSGPTIGILALQGNFDSHRKRLEELGAFSKLIRKQSDFAGIDGLVIPGGESTALLRLSTDETRKAVISAASRIPLLATCAGTILLARAVRNPTQESLELLDIEVSRNGFGRQVDSFITSELQWSKEGRLYAETHLAKSESDAPEAQFLEGVFIRAPRILAVGPNAEVLLHYRQEPVLVRQGRILAATFHPELSVNDTYVHRLFLALCRSTECSE